MEAILLHPQNKKQLSAFKKLFKTMNVPFETKEETKVDVLNNLKKGFEEMKLIKNGKLETTPLKDFLNEL